MKRATVKLYGETKRAAIRARGAPRRMGSTNAVTVAVAVTGLPAPWDFPPPLASLGQGRTTFLVSERIMVVL